MADRIEREIEEILAKLDDLPAESQQPERRPVSIVAQREKRQSAPPPPRMPRREINVRRLNPAAFLLAGAGTVIGGLILSNIWAPLIWAAFAGVVVFIAGFVASFFKTKRTAPAGAEAPQGHYWRDRYIEYQPSTATSWSKLRRRFRR